MSLLKYFLKAMMYPILMVSVCVYFPLSPLSTIIMGLRIHN